MLVLLVLFPLVLLRLFRLFTQIYLPVVRVTTIIHFFVLFICLLYIFLFNLSLSRGVLFFFFQSSSEFRLVLVIFVRSEYGFSSSKISFSIGSISLNNSCIAGSKFSLFCQSSFSGNFRLSAFIL